MYQPDEFIPIPRDFPRWFKLFGSPRCVQLFLYLLFEVRLEDDDFARKPIHRGQLMTTGSEICRFLGMTREQLRWATKKLNDGKYIYVKSDKTRGTLYTVRGFDRFFALQGSGLPWVKCYKGTIFESWFVKPEYCSLYLSLLLRNKEDENEVSINALMSETGFSSVAILRYMRSLKERGVLRFSKLRGASIIRYSLRGDSYYSVVSMKEMESEEYVGNVSLSVHQAKPI